MHYSIEWTFIVFHSSTWIQRFPRKARHTIKSSVFLRLYHSGEQLTNVWRSHLHFNLWWNLSKRNKRRWKGGKKRKRKKSQIWISTRISFHSISRARINCDLVKVSRFFCFFHSIICYLYFLSIVYVYLYTSDCNWSTLYIFFCLSVTMLPRK